MMMFLMLSPVELSNEDIRIEDNRNITVQSVMLLLTQNQGKNH